MTLPTIIPVVDARNYFPMSAPDNRGMRRKLTVSLSIFNQGQPDENCEAIQFRYSFGKGDLISINLDPNDLLELKRELQNVVRSRDYKTKTLEKTFKNRPSNFLIIGRGEDKTPFLRLKGNNKEGKERYKDFFFVGSNNTKWMDGNTQENTLITQERSLACFIDKLDKIITALDRKYKAREFQQGGGYNGGGNGGYNGGYNGGGNGGGYQQPQQQRAPQAPAAPEISGADLEGMFD